MTGRGGGGSGGGGGGGGGAVVAVVAGLARRLARLDGADMCVELMHVASYERSLMAGAVFCSPGQLYRLLRHHPPPVRLTPSERRRLTDAV